MTSITDIREMKARIIVFGIGGAGGNAINNMIAAGLQGVDFIVANTDAQALTMSKAERVIQMGIQVTEGLGAGAQPEVGRAAAEEAIDEIRDHLTGAHMVFITAGMGGGTGTGAAPIIAKAARELGILTIGVVTKPFHFEGQRRMRFAEVGIAELLGGGHPADHPKPEPVPGGQREDNIRKCLHPQPGRSASTSTPERLNQNPQGPALMMVVPSPVRFRSGRGNGSGPPTAGPTPSGRRSACTQKGATKSE
jgi:hypothetical protein